jgi:two-component system response regulator AtoC
MDDRKKILVADDDQSIRSLLQTFLESEGFNTVEARSGRDVIPALTRHRPDLVIMDVRMPGMSGLDVLDQMKRMHVDTPVLTMTAYGTSNVAIEAIQRGAYDYVTKPFELDDLLITVRRTLDHRDLALKVRLVDETIRDPLDNIIGNSSVMQQVYKTIGRVARTEATVLLMGESGTGKELVAGALHFNSHRRNGPYVKVPCASLTETLLESELFGHEAGSFTSAVKTRKGRFEMADKGTIFLDEIGSTRRRSFCVCCKRENSKGSAAILPSKWIPASSLRPIRAWRRRWLRDASEKTSTIASTSSPSSCLRCATAWKTCHCSSSTSCRNIVATRRRTALASPRRRWSS